MPLLSELKSSSGVYLYDLISASVSDGAGAGATATTSAPGALLGLRVHLTSKTWSGIEQADGWIYGGPPEDETGPTAPEFTLTVEGTQSLRVKITEAALDSQTQVGIYIVDVSTTSDVAGFTEYARFARDVAEASAGFLLTGLSAVQTWVRIRGRDNSPALNLGDYSDVETATPSAPAPVTSIYANYPAMNWQCLQATATYGFLGSEQEKEYISEADGAMAQWWYPNPTRNALRFSEYSTITTPRLALYVNYNEVPRTVASPGNSAPEIGKELADSATEGNSNWYARRLNGDRVGPVWDRAGMSNWQMNGCVTVAGRNSRNEHYGQAFARTIEERFNSAAYPFFDEYFSAVFIDVCQAVPPVMYLSTSTSTTVSDMDYDQDGVIDARGDYTTNGGGARWARGTLAVRDAFKARFGSSFEVIPNGGRWDFNYEDGSGAYPPLPMSNHPFYRQWTTVFDEVVNLNVGINLANTTTYTKASSGHVTIMAKRMNIMQRFLKVNDSDSPTGRCAVIIHAPAISRGDTAEPSAADINFARFMFGMCMLENRCAFGVTINGQRAMRLDELHLNFGNPVGQRSLGTLNESTLSFSLRAPNVTNGSATLHTQLYQQPETGDGVLVAVRTDTPPTGTVLFEGGSTVTFTLPTPPAGKKYRAFNSATYVNPNTERATRGQNTTLNNGADKTTVSLAYYGAQFFEVVDA